jgi:hypothetical protein
LLANGPYIATAPISTIHLSADRSSLKVLPIKLSASPRPVAVVTLKNRTLSPIVERFIDYAPHGHEINFYPAASQQILNSTKSPAADAVVEDLLPLLMTAHGPPRQMPRPS